MSSDENHDNGKKNSDLFKDVTYGSSMLDIDEHKDEHKVKKSLSSEFVTLGGLHDHHGVSGGSRPSLAPSIKSEAEKDPSIDATQYDDYDQITLDSQANDAVSAFKKHKLEEVKNLEAWWVASPTWRRTVVFMCITSLLMTILNVVLAIYFFTAKERVVADPYVCTTPSCVEVSDWIADSMNLNANPCEDFYNYVCGNYQNEAKFTDVPPKVSFRKASVEFSGAAFTASILKPTPKNLEKVIPFYKACLDLRRRNARSMDILISILNETLGEFFSNIDEFDTGKGPAKVIEITRRYGTFSFQLLDFPNIAILPPAPWVRRLRQLFDGEGGGQEFQRVTHDKTLPFLYKKLWEKLFTRANEPPNMSYNEAADLLIKYFDTISKLGVHMPNAPPPKLNQNVSERIERILEATFQGTYKIDNSTVEVSNRLFTRDDLSRTIQTLNSNFSRPQLQRMVVSFYIFNILEFFKRELIGDARADASDDFNAYVAGKKDGNLTGDLNGSTAERLRLHTIFIDAYFEKLLSTLEGSCFDSTINYLNRHAILRLIEAFGFRDVNEIADVFTEVVRRIQRVFRKVFTTHIRSQLSEHHAYATETFVNAKNFIRINFPFESDGNTSLFSEAAKYFDKFTPGPDHLLNVYNAAKIYRREYLKAWRSGKSQRFTRPNFNLEIVQQFPDNFIKYENNMYPPISLLDKPFFLRRTELRTFTRGGAWLFLARSVIELWKNNIDLLDNERGGPLAKIINLTEWDRLKYNQSDVESKSVPTCLDTADNTTEPSDFLSDIDLLNILTFKIGLELIQNRSVYITPRDKLTRALKLNIEPMFYPNGSVRYIDVDENPNYSDDGRESIDRNQFDTFLPRSMKITYTKAPGRLVNFTPEQVFFLTAVRHQCYSRLDVTDGTRNFSKNVNRILGALPEFSKAWNCPAGSPMNSPMKCL